LAECLAPQEIDSGSNTSVEADVEDDRLVAVKHASTSTAVVSTGGDSQYPDTVSLERSGRDIATEEELGVGSVNVFVVESKQIDPMRDSGTLNSDMKPLLIQGDVDFHPTVPQPDPDAVVEDTTQEDITGPAAVSDHLQFQFVVPSISSTVTQTDSGDVFRVIETGGESSKESSTLLNKDVVQQPKPENGNLFQVKVPASKVANASDLRPPAPVEGRPAPVEKPAAVAAGPRPVVELNYSVVANFCASWFESPWIAYLLVVVGVTLTASATEADPGAVIVTVLVASALCFCFFPPPSNAVDDTPTVRRPE